MDLSTSGEVAHTALRDTLAASGTRSYPAAEYAALYTASCEPAQDDLFTAVERSAAHAANALYQAGPNESHSWQAEQIIQCALLRDIFCLFASRHFSIAPTWRTPQALALARTAYEERRWEDLPLLADALEEAGCTEETVLSHLRGPGPHVRGCWPVDLLLGKG
jgi:hypothetical protein